MNQEVAPADPREARLHEVLGAYLEASDRGWAPPRDELMTRYPDLASDLRSFFALDARVAEIASPTPMPRRPLEEIGRAAQEHPTVAVAPPGKCDGAAAPLTIGDYESLEILRSGGMGIVYKARQKGAHRWVAVKMLLPDRQTSAGDLQRFRDEAKAVANLDHPNIVPIYEVGEYAGQPYFSMKLFERGSLNDHLAQFTKDPRASARLLATVARAVHYAHQRGILHRDLKPANILLDDKDQPHVADFGLAKRLHPSASVAGAEGAALARLAPQTPSPDAAAPDSAAPGRRDESQSYVVPKLATQALTTISASGGANATALVGTPGYMPPEQTDSRRGVVSTGADVYSIGAILYKMLTGDAPFVGLTASDIIHQVRTSTPIAPHTRNPRVDRRLEAICMKCLEKEVRNRYASAEALADDLERWLAGEPPVAWPMPRSMRTWRAARRYLATALLVSVVSVSASAAFFLLYQFDPDRLPRNLEQASRRHKVTLIGATGHPDWSRWNIGEGTMMVRPEKDKPFAFATLEAGRLELLRQAPAPRYRIGAEIRHEDVFNQGAVGVYFGQHAKQTHDGVHRYWCDVTFADIGATAAKSAVQLSLQRHSLLRGFTERLTESRLPFESAMTAKRLTDWRRLSVEVTPEKIQVCFDGKPLPPLIRAELRKLENRVVINNEVIIPEYEFADSGGLGLYVYRGRASFRNVTIEPLP